MKNILVTGGSGKAGRFVVQHLIEHGYTVLNADVLPSPGAEGPFLKVDLNDMGQAIDAVRTAAGTGDHPFRGFEQADAVVHLAAIRAPDLAPEGVTFQNNIMSTWNVFSAATLMGVKRIVWASSETTFGLPFARTRPAYAPLDEAAPLLPESNYSLTKVLGEEMARQMHRWNPDTTFVGLRISNVMDPSEYAGFAAWQDDPHIRKWNLWSYVDGRDVAQACRRGLESGFTGVDHFTVAAADSCMAMTNRELMAAVYPDVPLKEGTGDHDTLLAVDKARRVLGYDPQYSWRDA